MSQKMKIEDQVAELTLEQQDKIVKVGKIATALQLIGGIPWFIVAILGIWTMISPPLGFDYNDYDKLFLGLIAWLIIGGLYVVGILVFVKIKYPYYSDAKCNYIIKIRKGK